METPSIILPRLKPREGIITRIGQVLASLDEDKAWRVSIEEYKPTRSGQQNRYLWAIYGYILKVGGETMGGWTKDDLHEFFLGEHLGWERKELFGRPRMVPVKRSSRMNKQEFADFIAFIQQYMAERGVFIPDAEHWDEQVAA